jgi:hypothetical protein
MLIRLRNRGQNTAEYAILIGLVIAAVVAMQTYVKRALQGRSQAAIHWMANHTSAIDSQTANLQYEPYYQESDFTVRQQQRTQNKHYRRRQNRYKRVNQLVS